MNLLNLTESAISIVVPRRLIDISVYTGQSVDAYGIVNTTRTTISGVEAHIELANNQRLEFVNGFSMTKIYKDFYFSDDVITGLNRNLSTGGDYIISDGLYYRIVEVDENYKVGWVHVVGEESTSIDGA